MVSIEQSQWTKVLYCWQGRKKKWYKSVKKGVIFQELCIRIGLLHRKYIVSEKIEEFRSIKFIDNWKRKQTIILSTRSLKGIQSSHLYESLCYLNKHLRYFSVAVSISFQKKGRNQTRTLLQEMVCMSFFYTVSM